MEKDLQTQVSELRGLLIEWQRGQNRVNADLIRCTEAANRLDDYRGQQIGGLEHRLDVLSAAVRASYVDPAETAERILRSVDDE